MYQKTPGADGRGEPGVSLSPCYYSWSGKSKHSPSHPQQSEFLFLFQPLEQETREKQEMGNNTFNFDDYFDKMQSLVTEKKCNSRVRCLIMVCYFNLRLLILLRFSPSGRDRFT